MISQFDKFNRACALVIISAIVLLCMGSRANASELLTDTETIRIPAEASMSLRVENLVGGLRVESTRGNAIEVEITRSAGGDDRAEAEAMLEKLKIVRKERGEGVALIVEYPVDEHRNYRYPGMGRNSYNTRTRYQGRKVRVSSRKSGVTLFADFVIRMPDDLRLKYETVVGEIRIAGVKGDMKLDVSTGNVETADTQGRVDMDTGSGSIAVKHHEGTVRADTGSGSVTVEDVTGDVVADTGSGSVAVRRVTGDVDADTGSGRVLIEDVVADVIRGDTGSGSVRVRHSSGALYADTGSGSVEATDFVAGEEIWVDTGSGSVTLDGDLGRVRRLSVDTGSGNISLRTSTPPSLVLQAEQGSGRPRINLPDTSDVRTGDDWYHARIGGGEGRADIDTGSGRITFDMK